MNTNLRKILHLIGGAILSILPFVYSWQSVTLSVILFAFTINLWVLYRLFFAEDKWSKFQKLQKISDKRSQQLRKFDECVKKYVSNNEPFKMQHVSYSKFKLTNSYVQGLDDLKIMKKNANYSEQRFNSNKFAHKEQVNIIKKMKQILSKATSYKVNPTEKEKEYLQKRVILGSNLKEIPCYQIINDYIDVNLENIFELIEDAFQAITSFLLKAFSLSISLSLYPQQQQISYSQFKSLISILKRGNAIPNKYTCNLSLNQLKHQLTIIQPKIKVIPDLDNDPNTLKMYLYIQCLKQDFPEERIFIQTEVSRQDSLQKTHIFYLLENGSFFYNKCPEIKSKNCEFGVLMFLIEYYKKNVRTKKSIVCELIPYFQRMVEVNAKK